MHDILRKLGLEEINPGAFAGGEVLDTHGDTVPSENPTTGEPLASVKTATAEDCGRVIDRAHKAFLRWRTVPAPVRGELVRRTALALREVKEDLGALVSLEMGKIRAEGEGEVQEMIDMADFCVGLSRQLYGVTMKSERPRHKMYEQWHPLGVIGIISAFNFPVAVWAWNAMLGAVCGDTHVWKPSSKTPLTAIAVQRVMDRVVEDSKDLCDARGVFNTFVGPGRTAGEALLADRRVPMISATGSCRMGRRIGAVVGGRLASTILELGGNNAVIVLDDADLDMALRAVLFGAVGTTGQRCTSIRRLLLQKGIAGEFTDRLVKAYAGVRIGDPLEADTVMGPLVDEGAVKDMMDALEIVRQQGGEVLCGGKRIDRPGHFAEPTIVKAHHGMAIVQEETFAPLLYVFEVEDLHEAMRLHNDVPQGLSSSIFTDSVKAAERFLSAEGSDCGIANVNISTSGAEIGGAFGGEKDTGGGREAGSDAWKAYMRRQTSTINWGDEMPFAQGIEFGD